MKENKAGKGKITGMAKVYCCIKILPPAGVIADGVVSIDARVARPSEGRLCKGYLVGVSCQRLTSEWLVRQWADPYLVT